MAGGQNTIKNTGAGALFYVVAVGYIIVTFASFFIIQMQPESLNTLKDFIKTISTTNITIGIGLAAILIALASINKKTNDNTTLKKEFITTIRAYIYFIFLNGMALMLSYINTYSGNWISVLELLLTHGSLIGLTHSVIVYAKKILPI